MTIDRTARRAIKSNVYGLTMGEPIRARVIEPDPAWLAEFNRKMAAERRRSLRWSRVSAVAMSVCLLSVLLTIAWVPACALVIPSLVVADQAAKRSL